MFSGENKNIHTKSSLQYIKTQHVQYINTMSFKPELNEIWTFLTALVNVNCECEKRTKIPADTSSESEVHYLTPCLLNHSGIESQQRAEHRTQICTNNCFDSHLHQSVVFWLADSLLICWSDESAKSRLGLWRTAPEEQLATNLLIETREITATTVHVHGKLIKRHKNNFDSWIKQLEHSHCTGKRRGRKQLHRKCEAWSRLVLSFRVV